MPDQHTTPSTPESVNREVFKPVAGILAIMFPGAGHVYLRQTWRGVGVAVGVLGLFFGGILIGGIDVIDRKEDTIWFVGQALVGPIAFATDRYHQSNFKAYGTRSENGSKVPDTIRTGNPGEVRKTRQGITYWDDQPGARPPNSKSLAHPNEIGTLFATIAGMLNLIAILDALFHRESRTEIDPGSPADSTEPTADPKAEPSTDSATDSAIDSTTDSTADSAKGGA